MKVYLPCDGLDCDCLDHVDTTTHVPCCPIHGTVLVAGDAGMGQCLWTASRAASRVERLAGVVKTCATWSASSWVWKPRARFASEDLPPYNGWEPVDLEAAGVTP